MPDPRYPTSDPVHDPLAKARLRVSAIVTACAAGATVLDPDSELDAVLLTLLAEIAGFAGSALALIDQAASETVG